MLNIRKSHLVILVIFPILLLIYLTRFPTVYIDEMWHIDTGWIFATTGRLAVSAYGDTFGCNLVNYQPPVFNLMMGLWIKLFGLGLFQARLLIVVIAAIILFFTYLIAKSIYNDKVGILSAVLLFFSWFSLFRYTRYDIPLALFFLIGFYLFLKVDDKKNRYIMYFLSGFFCGLSSIAHLYGGIGAISILVLFLARYKFRGFFRKELGLFIAGVAIPLSIYGVYLYSYYPIIKNQALIFAGERFGIFSPNFYLHNVVEEIKRWITYLPFLPLGFSLVAFLIFYRKKWKKHSRILIIIFTFLILFSFFVQNKTFLYLAPVIPFIAIASSILWMDIWEKNKGFLVTNFHISRESLRGIFGLILILIIILRPCHVLYRVWYKYGLEESNISTYLQSLHKYIPPNSVVLGQYAYWIGFPNNMYYQEFMVTAMKRVYHMKFSEVVKKKKIEYIIVDETLLHYQRDPNIEPFLNTHCMLVGNVKNKLYSNYPGYGTEDDGITRIYKVNVE